MLALIHTRNAADGWLNTHAPASAVELMRTRDLEIAPETPAQPSDPALAAFHAWAGQ